MLKGFEENKLLLTFSLACEEGDAGKIEEILPHLDFIDRFSLVFSSSITIYS